jgi:hypothetical protein
VRFRSLSAFDMHREGAYSGTSRQHHTRHCLSVAEMRAKGMKQADNGAWTSGREFVKVAA